MQKKQKHTDTVIHTNREQAGFSHILILGVIVIAGIGATGYTVVAANHKHSKTVNLTNTSAKQANSATVTNAPATAKPLATSTTTSTSTKATPSTSSKTTTTSAAPPVTTKSSTTTTPTTTPTAPAETPLSALTTIISNLQAGQSAQVTAQSVSIPGPITTAHGQPLVFTVNGQTYFAYTQTQKPNFNTTAAQTAGTMAIVNATVSNPTLASAHLDKSNNLVDPNSAAVGYSTGGN